MFEIIQTHEGMLRVTGTAEVRDYGLPQGQTAFQTVTEGLSVALQKQYLLFAQGWVYTTEP